jgi:phosphohistidine phosphatase SixA
MDIINELESQFEALRTGRLDNKPAEVVRVEHLGGVSFLVDLVVGSDFVAGTGNQKLLVFPTSAVITITANVMPEPQQKSLSDLLAAQRNPVRVNFSLRNQLRKGWLLSEHGPWLRIAAE